VTVVGVFGFVSAAHAVTNILTITGTASCDAAASSWIIQWQVLSNQDTTGTVTQVIVGSPGTLTGLAVGDSIPPAQSGPMHATEVLPSNANWSDAGLKIVGQWGTVTGGGAGFVPLGQTCGHFIQPTVTFQASCDGTLHTHVTLDASDPAGTVAFETWNASGAVVISKTVTVSPGGSTSFNAAPGYQALFVRVSYLGVFIGNGEWSRPDTCGPPPGQVPLSGLYAHADDRWVTAEAAGSQPLIANRGAIDQWERFEFITNADGSTSLRSYVNDKYVTAEAAGAKPLIANRTAIGLWEKFQLITNSDGSISLRSYANGRYVTAEAAGAQPLIANRTAIGPWEKFGRFSALAYLPLLANADGRYVTAESAGTQPLIANRTAIGPWEQFLNDGAGSLLSNANNRYVSTDFTNHTLIANSTVGDGYAFINNPDGSLSLLSMSTRMFVSARAGASGPLIADSPTIGPAEEFNRPTG
jgi:hypothetical protein